MKTVRNTSAKEVKGTATVKTTKAKAVATPKAKEVKAVTAKVTKTPAAKPVAKKEVKTVAATTTRSKRSSAVAAIKPTVAPTKVERVVGETKMFNDGILRVWTLLASGKHDWRRVKTEVAKPAAEVKATKKATAEKAVPVAKKAVTAKKK